MIMSLTEISYNIRKYFPYAILGFIFLFVFYFFIISLINYISSLSPKKIAIEPIFGKLTKIVPSQKIDTPNGINYVLDTIDAEPYSASSAAQIFFLPQKTTQFEYLQKIYLSAKQVGFATDTIKHSMNDENAIFEDSEKKLSIDVTYFNYEYELNIKNNKKIFNDIDVAFFDIENSAKREAKKFVEKIKTFPTELAQGKEVLIYLKYDQKNEEFNIVDRKEEADAIEIDYYRPEINEVSIISPKYFNSQNFVVLTFSKEKNPIILKSQIKFFDKETDKIGVYPLKTGKEAWEEFQKNNGTIIYLGSNNGTIKIKKMFLSYYDFDDYQPYLQPVYVFLGENGFVGFANAVKNEYLD